MGTLRSHSPFDLPPLKGTTSERRSKPRAAAAVAPGMSRLPVSFGVLLLTSVLVLLAGLAGTYLAYLEGARHARENMRAAERRLGQQIQLLQASASTARAERALNARKALAAETTIEQLKTELDALRTRNTQASRRQRSR